MSGWIYVHAPSILLGAIVASVACGIGFYTFVRRAGADWRRR